MKEKVIYNKLVRDKIPEIIEASGKICEMDILSDEEYLQMLDKKLDEELAEYHQEQNIEELADILEVLYATAGQEDIPLKNWSRYALKSKKHAVGLIRKSY